MRVLLSLGSNVGDRAANLRGAVRELGFLGRVQAISRMYETEPQGMETQPWFLNMAAALETDLELVALLHEAKRIEKALGRMEGTRWGPRVIDIDLILAEGSILESDELRIPHPEFRKRAFVLAPLAEIAPEAIDPVTGQSVARLLQGARGIAVAREVAGD